MNEEEIKVVEQKKTDALSGKHLHVLSLDPLRATSTFIDALAISVPILFLSARYLVKGQTWDGYVEGFAEICGTLLIVLTIVKMTYRLSERVASHSKLRDVNIELVSRADGLLRSRATTNSQEVSAFLELARMSEKEDYEIIGNPKPELRHKAYRAALKEYGPGHVCPICHASPWEFKSGSCEACGNTPKKP